MKETISSTSFCIFVASAHQNQLSIVGFFAVSCGFFPPAIAICCYGVMISMAVLHVDLVENDCCSLGCCPHN